MTSLYKLAWHRLADASFELTAVCGDTGHAFLFENDTILGFAILYDGAADLISRWSADADRLIVTRRFQLKAAGQKAWNAYVLLLAASKPSTAEAVTLSLIEEDLRGYRKVARAGCDDLDELNRALLPLLPVQAAPILDAVDSKLEVRQRATEISGKLLDAFLSEADEQIVLQILEQEA
jgi:hypothetical protein